IEALTSDVSIGGFRLMTPAPLESGTKLDLEIQLGEEGIPIHAEAEVMWQSKNSNVSYETGVQITHMPDKDKSQFMSFVFDQMSKIVGNHAIASGEKN
ncbi:MAG: PilZ domain-containing protein, partial [Deltaproteobacteria bacterium]|nr:PilZ domain-containing protein [Deltaproteobacteria bacterium]